MSRIRPPASYFQQLTKIQGPGYTLFVFGIYSGYAASVRACQGDSACDLVRFTSASQDQPCCCRVAETQTTLVAPEPVLASGRITFMPLPMPVRSLYFR